MKRFRYLILFALEVLLVSGPRLHAQTNSGGGDQPQTAFGAGRMVQGTVTAVTPDQVTLKTEAGDIYKVSVSPNTQVRKDRAQMKLADVHPGDGVGAMGEIDRPNRTVHALMVYVVDAEQIRKARENLGKTYIAGKITAINADDLKLTVLRSDGVSQVIQVDEGTSFKRGGRGMQQAMGLGFGDGTGAGARQGRTPAPAGAASAGESITLADIKVGDLVGGPGALKSGVFIPTELSVGTPGARGGGGRRRGNEGTPQPGAPAALTPQEPR